MKKAISLLFLGMVGCAGLKLSESLTIDDRDWPQFGKTSVRVNATDELVRPPLKLAWEYDITSGAGQGSPIVIDSTVIVTNLRGELYGINANTGKRIGWVTVGDAIHSSPVIEANVAYLTSANSRESLIAYDLFEGKVRWKQEYGDVEASPLLHNDKLYFGNIGGIFFGVEKDKGEFAWRFKLPENTKRKGIRSTATAVDEKIIFGAEDGVVYALQAGSGTPIWTHNSGAAVFASPAIHNGKVFVGNMEGKLLALDVNDGTVRWQFDAGSAIYATPSFTDTILLIGTTGGKLFALNATTGAQQWVAQFSAVINSSAVISGSFAYLGTLKKELIAVNLADGTTAWKETLQGRIKTSPAIAGGRLYVATDDKLVLAFKPIEGN